MDVLCIEWILMQDYRGTFQAGRRRLPGQNYPGWEWGARWCTFWTGGEFAAEDALLNMPEYFHKLFFTTVVKFVDPAAPGNDGDLARSLLAGTTSSTCLTRRSSTA
jgi:hypothetical protein